LTPGTFISFKEKSLAEIGEAMVARFLARRVAAGGGPSGEKREGHKGYL